MHRRLCLALAVALAASPAMAQFEKLEPLTISAPPPYFSRTGDYAGKLHTPGLVDGWRVSTSRFYSPQILAPDGKGGLFVLDANNDAIRHVGENFANTWQKLPTGYANQIGGMAWHEPTKELLITNKVTHTIMQVGETGVWWRAGSQFGASGLVDGNGVVARFNAPGALAVDAAGMIYVSDSGNRAIRKIDPGGYVVSTKYTHPSTAPGALAVIPNANALYAVFGAGIFRVDLLSQTASLYAGDIYNLSTYLPSAIADGDASVARFSHPTALALDAAGNLFVSDWALVSGYPTNVTVTKGFLRQISPPYCQPGKFGTITNLCYNTTVATLALQGETIYCGNVCTMYTDKVLELPLGIAFVGSRLIYSDALRDTLRYAR